MGETSEQIVRHIQETRKDLGENLSELEERVKTAVDWRAQVEERPGTMMALAFGGGVVLSALLPTPRSTHRRTSGRGRNKPPVRDNDSFESSSTSDDNASQPSNSLNAIKGALFGLAASKLSSFIEDLLPGFKQELTKGQFSKSPDRPDRQG